MPTVSQAQQKLMGMAYAYKKGDMKKEDASKEVKELADSMSIEDLKDYAETKHDDLPAKKESKDNPDEEELENDGKKPLESKEPKKMKHLKTFEDFVRECEGDKDDDSSEKEILEFAPGMNIDSFTVLNKVYGRDKNYNHIDDFTKLLKSLSLEYKAITSQANTVFIVKGALPKDYIQIKQSTLVDKMQKNVTDKYPNMPWIDPYF